MNFPRVQGLPYLHVPHDFIQPDGVLYNKILIVIFYNFLMYYFYGFIFKMDV